MLVCKDELSIFVEWITMMVIEEDGDENNEEHLTSAPSKEEIIQIIKEMKKQKR